MTILILRNSFENLIPEKTDSRSFCQNWNLNTQTMYP